MDRVDVVHCPIIKVQSLWCDIFVLAVIRVMVLSWCTLELICVLILVMRLDGLIRCVGVFLIISAILFRTLLIRDVNLLMAFCRILLQAPASLWYMVTWCLELKTLVTLAR